MSEKIMMTINVDNQIKMAKKLSVEEKLSDLRKLLGEKILETVLNL